MDTKREQHGEATAREKAAHADRGQNQDPSAAREGSSTLWDTDQHSKAPGPFGTGDGDED